MRGRRFWRVVLFACAHLFASVCLAAQNSPVLTTLSAIHALTNPEADRTIPVAFEATVTYYQKGNIDLLVQDGDAAIYIETVAGQNLQTGDRVLVEGITRASFRPEILGKKITVLHHGEPPPPVSANFGQLIRAELDCRRVTIRATVRAANFFSDGISKSGLLDLYMPGGNLQAQIASGGSPEGLNALLDTTVELTGAVAGKFDSKNQMTGILLEVPSFADVHVVKAAPVAPHQLPTRPFDEVLQATRMDDRTERVRVEGTITYYQAGAALVLQDGAHALWVDTRSEETHNVGDHGIVSGFPDVRNGSVVLTRAEIVSTPSRIPPQIEPVDAVHLASGTHAFELVSVEGELIMRVREAAQDQYVIAVKGHVFSAIYRHPERGLNLPPSPMRDFHIGSRVRATGICVLDRGDQFRGPVAFHLLLRDSQDMALIAGPSLISVRNLAMVLGLLLILLFVATGRAWLLERKLHRREIVSLSSVERWRSRVIDGINRAVPLPETLLQIAELLSFKLQVEHCWVQMEGLGTFGTSASPGDARFHIVEKEISAHSGQALGKICVAYQPSAGKRRIAEDALDNAVRLAALAIETGEKYSDLLRRSELDPLTKAHNRFGFDRALALAIEKARISAGRCGLIYIDLDDFKRINDDFGHSIGDRYLQEVVARLAHQLRPNDSLARIGGDEFCVIIESMAAGTDIQEIASRLQACFETAFCMDRYKIPGTASVGWAVYPQDATTQESLLDTADTRMYLAKRQKKEILLATAFDAPSRQNSRS